MYISRGTIGRCTRVEQWLHGSTTYFSVWMCDARRHRSRTSKSTNSTTDYAESKQDLPDWQIFACCLTEVRNTQERDRLLPAGIGEWMMWWTKWIAPQSSKQIIHCMPSARATIPSRTAPGSTPPQWETRGAGGVGWLWGEEDWN